MNGKETTSKLKIIPLGGLEQIGMNITAFEYEDSIIVVDCGLSFPEDEMYGIDLLIPDVTYLKDKQSVSDFLNIIGAHKSMMDMMMAQIEKDVRNNINRQINCRTANIDNIIKTSVKQCDAIRKLKNSKTWNELDAQTKELAEYRLKNVDANLTQLGQMLTPPISKSTVSRKMNRIIELSEEM